MPNITNILDTLLAESGPYSLDAKAKGHLFNDGLKQLSALHYNQCANYKNILDATQFDINSFSNENVPSLAVRLFKEEMLSSVPEDEIVKTLTSSGTTSQKVSKIYLDRNTSVYQTKVLVHIMNSYLGIKRLPMLIIDHPNVVKDRKSFSARGAGILGLSTFGRNHTYALNEDMEIDFDVISKFVEKHEGTPIFIFGFTFMIWQYFVEQLKASGKKLNLENSILVHSGGWKKLQERAVSNEVFKKSLKQLANIDHVYNFYGMVEQVGSIFVECEAGYLHTPNFANIRSLSAETWSDNGFGVEGIIEVESLLPMSYPGHKLLTEDIGTIFGEDNCKCGRKGKYFTISGRVPNAEVRGCSDTHVKPKSE